LKRVVPIKKLNLWDFRAIASDAKIPEIANRKLPIQIRCSGNYEQWRDFFYFIFKLFAT